MIDDIKESEENVPIESDWIDIFLIELVSLRRDNLAVI